MEQETVLERALPGTGAMIDFSGTWANELGSEMTLQQTNDRISGTYESAVSSGGQKTTGDLEGYVDGDLVSFLVHWRDFQAITAWSGQLEPGAGQRVMKTLWHLSKQVKTGEEWASINAGSDRFTRK